MAGIRSQKSLEIYSRAFFVFGGILMDNVYDYTTTEQQIQKLKSQLLTFENEKLAAQILQTYGYYNIINGYRDPYIIREYGTKKYCPDVTFEQIFALFMLDHEIRDAVLLSMIDLEEHLRAVVAYIIAEDFGSDYKKYLEKNNYRDRTVSNPRFRSNKILEGMQHTAESSHTQPIKYYREQHGVIPPWILLKGINFGTLINFIRFFKAKQRNKLIKILYADAVNEENIDAYKDLLSDTLFTCLEYRNLAAHGGRIYNYIPTCNIRNFENSDYKKGLPQFVASLSYIKYGQPYYRIKEAITRALNTYCPKYPNDLDRLGNAIGFHIFEEQYVWVNKKTGKMHTNPHCSGSRDCIRIPYHDALNQNYVSCKRCCSKQNK